MINLVLNSLMMNSFTLDLTILLYAIQFKLVQLDFFGKKYILY
jgi:hypothetical protein